MHSKLNMWYDSEVEASSYFGYSPKMLNLIELQNHACFKVST